jgi:Asp-tRNA(Asn)/Glu-tRNA(Gln) amidotransferase A subunit family amidase
MVTTAMDTICAQDGLFGFVGDSSDFLEQAASYTPEDLALPEGVLPSISQLVRKYRAGTEDPIRTVNMVYDRIEQYRETDPEVWTHIQSRDDVLATTESLAVRYKDDKHNMPPLFGVPFAVQDRLDVAGIPTTAACAGSYTPETAAPAVQVLLDAGAIFIGKLRSDQLAVDFLGCSSRPSSGAAVAVAAGLVPFALATDTTGDSLLSAGRNGVTTLKTTKGTISTKGTVPVCPSQDTISIMARNVDDARAVWLQIQKADNTHEPYAKPFASLPTWHIDARDPRPWKSKFRYAVPPASLVDEGFSDAQRELLNTTIDKLRECGGMLVEIDYEPFDTARKLVAPDTEDGVSLLVLEHIATVGAESITKNLSALHPELQKMYKHYLATAIKPWTILQTHGRQAECVQKVQTLFNPLNPDGIDILVVPGAPSQLVTDADTEEVDAAVAGLTRVVNGLDLCAVGVNARSTSGSGTGPGLPFGVTFIGGMGYDAKVLDVARRFEDAKNEQVSR